MTDVTWSDCDIALAGFSNTLGSSKEETVLCGKFHIYALLSCWGIAHGTITLCMFSVSTYTLLYDDSFIVFACMFVAFFILCKWIFSMYNTMVFQKISTLFYKV